ncbi:MAG: hypothetical protein AAF993_21530 [Pseudomonadota bacterium]
MSEVTNIDTSGPTIGQLTAEFWTAFGAAAGMQIELDVYDRSIAMGHLSNVEARLNNFANALYHHQALNCATQAGEIAGAIARDQGVDKITAEIFEVAAEQVRNGQQPSGGASAQPMGGIC